MLPTILAAIGPYIVPAITALVGYWLRSYLTKKLPPELDGVLDDLLDRLRKRRAKGSRVQLRELIDELDRE